MLLNLIFALLPILITLLSTPVINDRRGPKQGRSWMPVIRFELESHADTRHE